jgi:hypothetical protein
LTDCGIPAISEVDTRAPRRDRTPSPPR